MNDNGHIKLSALTSRIESILDGSDLQNLWVAAEINNLNINHSSGHCYLELIERDPLRGATTVTMRANIWASRYKLLASYFVESTGTPLAAGLKVLLRCSVTYHALYGIALNITDIDPAYTIGEAQRQRNITIATLKADGIFDMNRELELPTIAQRLAIVSSATAAGYGDFIHQLETSPFHFQITLFQATMQGADAETSVSQALHQIAERETEFDCAVIIRGGGATTDLQCFDSYIIATHITQMPLPVITGIGHERDTSVADLVAHTALKTPTAVAAFLISETQNFYNALLLSFQKITDLAQSTIIAQTAHTTTLSSKISQIAANSLSTQTLRLQQLSSTINMSSQNVINNRLSTITLLTERLKSSAHNTISTLQNRLQHLKELVQSRNPRNILSLGYSIVTTPDGKTIRSSNNIKIGDTLKIETADAIIDTTVNKKSTK